MKSNPHRWNQNHTNEIRIIHKTTVKCKISFVWFWFHLCGFQIWFVWFWFHLCGLDFIYKFYWSSNNCGIKSNKQLHMKCYCYGVIKKSKSSDVQIFPVDSFEYSSFQRKPHMICRIFKKIVAHMKFNLIRFSAS